VAFLTCRFSAEVFNGLQEEVTVTASRCQKLTSRVRRIESALSPLEKAVLSQTSHIHFAYTAGMALLLSISFRSYFRFSSLKVLYVVILSCTSLVYRDESFYEHIVSTICVTYFL